MLPFGSTDVSLVVPMAAAKVLSMQILGNAASWVRLQRITRRIVALKDAIDAIALRCS